MRHKVFCEYAEAPRSDSEAERQSGNVEPSKAASEVDETPSSSSLYAQYPYRVQTDFGVSEAVRHTVELYLIHRYKSSVAPAFPSLDSPALSEVWISASIDMSFEFPYLLNAVFAITSLYLWVTRSDPLTESERQPIPESVRDVDYAQLHRAYLNLSICQQKDALAALTPENADAVGLTAILLSTMATSQLSDSAASGEKTYCPPVQWLTMHASMASVFRNSISFLKPDGPLMTFFNPASDEHLNHTAFLHEPANSIPFQKLLDFRDPTDTAASDVRTEQTVQDAYQKAIAFLGGLHNAIKVPQQRRRICVRVIAFGHTVPKTFVDLLAEKRPRAVAILGNYMAFVKCIDHYWWFRSRAERELSGIQSILPQRWHWALEWPMAVVQDREQILVDPRCFQPVDM